MVCSRLTVKCCCWPQWRRLSSGRMRRGWHGNVLSLRRHDPDQVQRVPALPVLSSGRGGFLSSLRIPSERSNVGPPGGVSMCWRRRGHAHGSVMRRRARAGSRSCSVRVPPCASTTARAIDRPRPKPAASSMVRGVLAAHEGLEHGGLACVGNAGAVVLDLDAHPRRRGASAARTALAAMAHRVVDQVGDGALQLVRPRQDREMGRPVIARRRGPCRRTGRRRSAAGSRHRRLVAALALLGRRAGTTARRRSSPSSGRGRAASGGAGLRRR